MDGDQRAARLVFDADCGVCTRLATWLVDSWDDPALQIVSFQALGPDGCERLGFTLAEAAAAAWWVEDGARPLRGYEAIAASLRHLRGPWRLLGAVLVLPGVSVVADVAYRAFARFRHRLPGANACAVPAAP